MCDLYSWGRLLRDVKDESGNIILRRGKILYLTDAMVRACMENRPMLGEPSRESYVGHAAIAHYFHLSDRDDFQHEESLNAVPRVMVADINNGLLDGQYRASERFDPSIPPPRFTLKGKRKIVGKTLEEFQSQLKPSLDQLVPLNIVLSKEELRTFTKIAKIRRASNDCFCPRCVIKNNSTCFLDATAEAVRNASIIRWSAVR